MVSWPNSESSDSARIRSSWSDEDFSFTTQIMEDPSIVECNYPGPEKKCFCGRKALRFTDWKCWENPGRRYFACPDWVVEGGLRDHFCQYKEWCDPEFPPRTRRIINSMKFRWDWRRAERNSLEDQLAVANRDRKELAEDREHLYADIQGLTGELARKTTEKENLDAVVSRLNLKLKRKGAVLRNIAYTTGLMLAIFFAAGMWIGTLMSR